MFDELIKNLIKIKRIFSQNYSGNAHIQEIIPTSISTQFNMNENHLNQLHSFLTKNPIYYNSYEQDIEGVNCTVYEGDINEYWLNSIKHGSSCQPFYPTWMLSAYVISMISKQLGFESMVDIGSGDGRIAFSGKILGLDTHSIEIDDTLVNLQQTIVENTKQNFNPICMDALELDYSKLKLSNPVFVIGGLAQMGGDILATNLLEKMKSLKFFKKNLGMVFAGTDSKRQLSSNSNHGGWEKIILKNNLNVLESVSLPTVWTFDQLTETPYIFTKFN